jgi:hypothetical protein
LNLREIIKALRRGFPFVENLSWRRMSLRLGHRKAGFRRAAERWSSPAVLLAAAGTTPNITYERAPRNVSD